MVTEGKYPATLRKDFRVENPSRTIRAKERSLYVNETKEACFCLGYSNTIMILVSKELTARS